jgi:intracellular sulfur oxidation DsrE/DsrF family protein
MQNQNMKIVTAALLLHFSFFYGASQMALSDSTAKLDSVNKAAEKIKKDSADKAFLDKATYPLIKSSKWSGVIPVAKIDERPDPKQQYKLLLEVVSSIKDSTAAKDIIKGLSDAGRLINLHIASGIEKKNVEAVVVVHGGALDALLLNELYRKKYGTDNPNLPVLKELKAAGIKVIVCGQAMFFFNVKREEMIPDVKVSLTAQTVLSNYQLKGYVLYTLW